MILYYYLILHDMTGSVDKIITRYDNISEYMSGLAYFVREKHMPYAKNPPPIHRYYDADTITMLKLKYSECVLICKVHIDDDDKLFLIEPNDNSIQV